MADTVLLIHGYGCAGDVWGPVAARFRAEGYRVEAPTIRSAVRTVDGPRAGLAGLTLADYVAEMSAFAQTLAKETGRKPLVVGHSMGGLIAQKLAEAGHAEALVLFAPASPADARGKPKLSPVFTFLNMALQAKPETKAGKMWKPGFKFGVMNVVPAARHDDLYSKMVHDSGQVLADLAWPHKDPNRAAYVDSAKVTVPVLVLAGALDRTTPLDDVQRVARKYATADIKIYPNNAHYLIDEPNTMKILDDVIAWLTGKSKAATPAAAPAPATAKAAEPSPTPAPTPKPEPQPEPVKAAEPAPAPEPVKTEEPAPAAPKTAAAPKAAAKPRAEPKPKAAPAAKTTKAPAKPKAPAAEKKASAPKPAAKAEAAPKAKAAAEPKAKPAAAKPAATAKAKAPAKPKAEAAPAPAKAPAKPKAAPKAAAAKAEPAPKPAAAKKPATKSPAKASPKAAK